MSKLLSILIAPCIWFLIKSPDVSDSSAVIEQLLCLSGKRLNIILKSSLVFKKHQSRLEVIHKKLKRNWIRGDIGHVKGRAVWGGGYEEEGTRQGWRRWKSWISWRPAALMGREGGRRWEGAGEVGKGVEEGLNLQNEELQKLCKISFVLESEIAQWMMNQDIRGSETVDTHFQHRMCLRKWVFMPLALLKGSCLAHSLSTLKWRPSTTQVWY